MAKQTFGGDDDDTEVSVEEKKQKLDLSKFSAAPDVNPRDLFWTIMGSYASSRKPGVELASLEMDRFALIRVAIGALERPSPLHARLTPNYIARYTLMMMLDAGWKDVFVEFLEECGPRNKGVVLSAMKKLAKEEYSERMTEFLRAMLRLREESETALKYLADLGSEGIANSLKKELIILARGDIGDNQMNAIAALACIKDEDVVKTMIVLLSHWDDAARLAAAEVLLKMKDDSAKDAAKRRLGSESSPEIRAVLEKIAG